MDRVISEPCFLKGQFYKEIIGKWPFHGHFPNNSFVKFLFKFFGEFADGSGAVGKAFEWGSKVF